MNLTGKRVLIFGDSLSHFGSDSGPEVHEYTGAVTSSAPGAVMAGRLVADGAAAARTDARVSRSAVNFWSREDYAKLLRDDLAWQPDLVVVMLGTNDLHISAATDAQAMAGIRDAFAGIPIVAIGPPAFADSGLEADSVKVKATLRSVFGADNFIDGATLSDDLRSTGRAGDGVHFTAKGAEIYGRRLAQAVSAPEVQLPAVAAIGLGLGVVLVGFVIGRALHLR